MEKFITEFRTRGKAKKMAGAKYIRFGFQQLIRPCFEGSAPEKGRETSLAVLIPEDRPVSLNPAVVLVSLFDEK
jgi:hypothetical protein